MTQDQELFELMVSFNNVTQNYITTIITTKTLNNLKHNIQAHTGYKLQINKYKRRLNSLTRTNSVQRELDDLDTLYDDADILFERTKKQRADTIVYHKMKREKKHRILFYVISIIGLILSFLALGG